MQHEFKRRRQLLMHQVGAGNITIIASATIKIRNQDVQYPFRQNSDFYYLTGFAEPNAIAVFIPKRKLGEYIIFCRKYDPQKTLWEGACTGLEGAVKNYGADAAFSIDELNKILPKLLENKNTIYYPVGKNTLDHKILKWTDSLREKSRIGINAPIKFTTIEHLLHEMRLLKSKAEIKLLRKAAKVSAKAHIRAMQACVSCNTEYQIEAEVLHEFMRHGLRSSAYPAIVASGKNACVLHYTKNISCLRKGDLLLLDAGAECDHYAADITRTFPISGHFSHAQKQLYQLVLAAQLAAINKIRPGIAWNHVDETAIKVLTIGLVNLGILQGEVTALIANGDYKKFYMHRIGHWLGMDVHDVGKYKVAGKWRLLEPGMVLTIEPGLYIPADCPEVSKKWRGIGIRIEDDLLVTASGCDILSADVPKTIAEIETLMQTKYPFTC